MRRSRSCSAVLASCATGGVATATFDFHDFPVLYQDRSADEQRCRALLLRVILSAAETCFMPVVLQAWVEAANSFMLLDSVQKLTEQALRVDRPPPALCSATPISPPATQGQRWTASKPTSSLPTGPDPYTPMRPCYNFENETLQ